jgi:two-component system sensor histidine kinase QseC
MKMHTLWQASLAKRMLFALLVAFGLVAAALLTSDYIGAQHEFSATQDTALVRQVTRVGATLSTIQDPHDALVLMRAMQDQSRLARRDMGIPGELLIELRRDTGPRLYASPALKKQALNAPATGQGHQVLNGLAHRLAQIKAGSWVLVMAEPQLDKLTLLTLLGRDLAPSLALAFPFVVLPVWLAIRQGLRPLRRLSGRLAQRHADDLSSLDIDLKYAELQPVVSAFNALLLKLRDKVQRERAFVQDAAHELRTPMAVIAAQAHVLTRAASDAERLQAQDALEHAIERASHLARQLLALASLDDTRGAPLQPIDLAHLLQTTLAQAMPLAQQRGMDLSLDAPDSLPITTDLAAWQSIVVNLLDNALRYGRMGGQVAITLRVTSGELVLTVADDGPGIPQAERAHIFDRFARGLNHDVPGTGLGLAIVKQGVQRLQGSIRITEGLGPDQGVGFEVQVADHQNPGRLATQC